MPSTNKITTEDIAKAGRTTLRGVRLWDNLNLFGSVGRDEYGARVFTKAHLRRAAIISAAQMAGMTLPEIKATHEVVIASKIKEAMGFMDTVVDLINQEYDL